METNKQIEIHNEKVRFIIGQTPSILLYYGICSITFSIFILIGIAAIIPYQPAIETVAKVTQDEDGTLHYFAYIPLEAMKKQSQFAFVITYPESELLPDSFSIGTISDTVVYVSTNKAWYMATLHPVDASIHNVKLEKSITIPAKIILGKKSVLIGLTEKLWDN